jgi:hypothetical protein
MLGNLDVKDPFLRRPLHASHPLHFPHQSLPPLHLPTAQRHTNILRRNVAISQTHMFASSWQIHLKMPMRPSSCAPEVRPTRRVRRG